MRVAIMQPYFIPYVGYFQLMDAVDLFIIYDDVQFERRGWVNRNKIRLLDEPRWITVPVRKLPVKSSILSQNYMLDGKGFERVGNVIKNAYRNSPFYETGMALVEQILNYPDSNIVRFNANSLSLLAEVLGVKCAFMFSSEIDKPDDMKGQDKIIEICKRLGARRYVNAIGGMGLYDTSVFEREGIELQFIKTQVPPVPLSTGAHYLSVIDDLMIEGVETCRRKLTDYELKSK